MSESKTTELLPCPMCGGTDAYVEREDLSAYQVRCDGCGARGPVVEDGRFDEEGGGVAATTAWNTRPSPSSSLSSASGEVDLTETAKRIAWSHHMTVHPTDVSDGRDDLWDHLHESHRSGYIEAAKAVQFYAARTVQQPSAVREALEKAREYVEAVTSALPVKEPLLLSKVDAALAALSSAGEQRETIKAPAAPKGFPPVGSMVMVAGANSDTSDTERSYGERMVIGYTPCGQFVCFQTPGCWPYVERLANCRFRPLPAPPASTDGEG